MPVISEKSMNLVKSGFYTFEVSSNMTKPEIAKVISDKFKVDVISVRTINIAGKRKMQRSRRLYYSTPATKKAIVQLKKGQKIAIFEAPAEETQEVEVKTAEGEVIAKTKEKKSFLKGTKVKIETESREAVAKGLNTEVEKETPEKTGKTKGEKKGKKA